MATIYQSHLKMAYITWPILAKIAKENLCLDLCLFLKSNLDQGFRDLVGASRKMHLVNPMGGLSRDPICILAILNDWFGFQRFFRIKQELSFYLRL